VGAGPNAISESLSILPEQEFVHAAAEDVVGRCPISEYVSKRRYSGKEPKGPVE
jgi:hypothetical protein